MEVTGTVNVAGTVKVDNTAAIANYLDMARNAQDAGNNKEADEYCNRIIEMDVNNWEAWFLKGKAVGWQSTLLWPTTASPRASTPSPRRWSSARTRRRRNWASSARPRWRSCTRRF